MNPNGPRCARSARHQIGSFSSCRGTPRASSDTSCGACEKSFSTATFTPTYRQKRRRLKRLIEVDIASSTAQRRITIKPGCARNTVAQKSSFWRKERVQKPRPGSSHMRFLRSCNGTSLLLYPVCTLNTALLIFWESRADYFQQHYNKPPNRDLYGGYHRQAWDLIQRIRKNVESGKYKESTAPDGFKEKVVVVPPERQLWEIDTIMYGGVEKKYHRKRISKKKHITTKKIVANRKNNKKNICRTSKSLLQLHLDQLNGVTASKIQYFLGTEQRVNGSEESHSQLEACHVSQDVAQSISAYKALYFNSRGRLTEIRNYHEKSTTQAYDHDPWLQKSVQTTDHRYRKYEILEAYEFVPNKRGKSRIGGSPPAGFTTPVLSSGIALQYLGLLSHTDAAFRLRHDFHVVYPLHIDFCMVVWIDYKNPMAPTVINDKEISDLEGGDPDADENIILNLCQFKTVPWPTKTRHGGHTGLPRWIQGPVIPVCPETNKKMELICQLGDGDLSPSEKKNSVLGGKQGRYEESKLFAFDDGWIPVDGDLFVFFSRKSRIACYLYQGT